MPDPVRAARAQSYVTLAISLLTLLKMNYWLVKQEPEDYPWDKLVRDGGTAWTGVRNFQARNNLKAMRERDLVLYYHSGKEKRVVGIALVVKPAYPDPTASEGEWWAVDLRPWRPLQEPVGLDAIKNDKQLEEIGLVKQSRLSVVLLSRTEFERVLKLGGTSL